MEKHIKKAHFFTQEDENESKSQKCETLFEENIGNDMIDHEKEVINFEKHTDPENIQIDSNFVNKSNMKPKRTDVEKLKCNNCDDKFALEFELKMHLKSGSRNLYCEFCNHKSCNFKALEKQIYHLTIILL